MANKKVVGPHEDITYRINGAAMAVHRRVGPGQKEEVYQKALEAEFAKAGRPYGSVRISASPSVTAMVCSQCAHSLWSLVATVQWSRLV